MLCNLTSDLGEFLRDGENSILVSSVTAEGFCDALKKALALDEAQLRRIKNGARTLAERFDASRYAGVYKEILA